MILLTQIVSRAKSKWYKPKKVKKLALNSQLTEILTNDVQVLILCHSYFITTVIASMSSITLKKWQQIITKPTLAIKATKFSFVSNASQFIRPLNHGYFVRTMG